MIQPNELRIGNYVDYLGEIKPIISIDGESEHTFKGYMGMVTIPLYDSLGSIRDTINVWCENINPIPITPEILERLGFVFKDSYWTHKDIIYGVVFMGANIEVCFSLHGVITTIPHLPLNELHRFQNIIHSLSGIELTFKTN